ncbi:hypothetical protein AAFF_G00353930 [Aldrovandia affinis]|uniref:DUF4590 domain-containing protein n=1 Tax=Aldrovandia affinis TaxID=143900 RepID=A0AAD7SKH4_9TELE|nr:hypothetical protein AAFF_G00353930 [Aldrovandia affinis]
MSHLNPGLLSTYNSLTDKHLAGYFNNTRIRRHLQRVGLITRSGRIVPDKEYRHKLIRRDHQRHVRECLAQAIFHKVLDMERHHQIEIKRKLEDFARRERVHKIKVERSKRYDEDIIPLLSPRPPTGPRNGHKQHSGPEGEHSEFSESPGSSRPNTAPGKMQRPHRLQPIHSSSATASVRRTSTAYRHKDSSDDTEQQFSCMLDKDTRPLTVTEFSTGISPYQLPVINNYITPVPPSTKRNLKGTQNGMMRGRRLRPTTAPSAPAKAKQDSKFHKTSVHSNVSVTMVFYGKTVHLSHDDIDMRDEVKVFQQHCGGENLCVYKGRLMEGEAFQFISRRHRGFPFSLTFFLNGLQVDRLSSCCEFKHRKGSRLGGKHGHFGFSSVDGASPCYKCIISMGLDKKPTPPPKRTKEDMGRGSFTTNSQEVKEENIKQDSHSHIEPGPINGQAEDDPMKIEAKDMDEDKAKDNYEEDFEADDERADKDLEETKVQDVNPTSSSVRRDSKINNKDDGEIINHEMEDEEKGRYSNSEFEEDDKAEENKSSLSSRSTSSSSSREDSESEAEEVKEAVKIEEAVAEDETAQIPEEQLQIEGVETTSVPTAENDQCGLEEQMEAVDDGNLETSSQTRPQTTTTAEGDTETHQSHGDSTEKTAIELLDTSMHPEEGKEVDTFGVAVDSGDNAANPEGYSGDTEPERAKSVQEKLVEAIMKEAQCSSEPELSDTSTEEEEELSSEIKTMEQNNTGVGEDKTDIFPMQKPANTEGGQFESVVMPVEEASVKQPAEDQGICTEIEKELEVGDTPVSVQKPPTEADMEDESIVSIEDKPDNGVDEVGETDAKGEEMEVNRQTAVITAEEESKVEEANREPMAELEEGRESRHAAILNGRSRIVNPN